MTSMQEGPLPYRWRRRQCSRPAGGPGAPKERLSRSSPAGVSTLERRSGATHVARPFGGQRRRPRRSLLGLRSNPRAPLMSSPFLGRLSVVGGVGVHEPAAGPLLTRGARQQQALDEERGRDKAGAVVHPASCQKLARRLHQRVPGELAPPGLQAVRVLPAGKGRETPVERARRPVRSPRPDRLT